MSFPKEEPPIEDRRTYRRVGCRIPAANDSRAVVSDISEGGPLFSLHRTLSLSESFQVPIKLSEKILWVRIQPVWVSPAPRSNQFDLGARFIEMHQEDRDAIRDYVARRLEPKENFFNHWFRHSSKPQEPAP